jgi:murein tripeptide amidase MpaA
VRISSNFDGGNIECLASASPEDIRLTIRKDNESDFYQWFFFRLTGARGEECILKIENAGGAAYPAGWKDYRACASYDGRDWFRIPTEFADGILTFRHAPERDSVYFAYFAPYSMARHAGLIARALAHPLVRLDVPGTTLDGQDIDLLHIGEDGPDKKQCWLLARQHPGETMAEFWMEGFLSRLLDRADPLSRELLKSAVFHVVPNMNPDGSRRGHLRTNAGGANLNREWQNPTLERSPEVFVVRGAMENLGVDFCLDVHGDEAIPYNFLANTAGIPSLSDKQRRLQEAYPAALLRASPDFQTTHGYPENGAGKANLTMCTNYLGETFGCLALTLEMPFKDNNEAPDHRAGWSPARARKLGAANLDALYAVLADL